jgi:hypothetical protein
MTTVHIPIYCAGSAIIFHAPEKMTSSSWPASVASRPVAHPGASYRHRHRHRISSCMRNWMHPAGAMMHVRRIQIAYVYVCRNSKESMSGAVPDMPACKVHLISSRGGHGRWRYLLFRMDAIGTDGGRGRDKSRPAPVYGPREETTQEGRDRARAPLDDWIPLASGCPHPRLRHPPCVIAADRCIMLAPVFRISEKCSRDEGRPRRPTMTGDRNLIRSR